MKKRLTKNEREKRTAFVDRDKRTKVMIEDATTRANALRKKEREFHGLEREFLYYQKDMFRQYQESEDIKHPKSTGSAREEIVRKFLIDTGIVPTRYAASTSKARIASTTGHVTGELDIVFYDPLDSILLMRRQNAFDVLPVESTYGTIQVKSNATRKDIRDGLSNIASYKKLRRDVPVGWHISSGRPKNSQGFGILFAFDTKLDWVDLIAEIESFAYENPKHVWCNAIFVLSKGFVLHGTAHRATYCNDEISSITELQMHGRPDRDELCFYNLYRILLDLLENTLIQPTPIDKYFRLPFVAGEHSYQYVFGQFFEYGECKEHGDFARRLTEEKLVEVIEWCKSAEPMNPIRAHDIAYGKQGDDTEAYERQPGNVRIYNPDSLPLPDILLRDTPFLRDGKQIIVKSIAYDAIEASGMYIWISYYYEIQRGLINLCPKCEKQPKRLKKI